MKKRKPPILLVAILLVIGGAIAFMNYQTVAAANRPGEEHSASDGHDHGSEGRELTAPTEPAPNAPQTNQEDMKEKLGKATGATPGPKLPQDDKPKVMKPGAGEPPLKPDENAVSSQWYRDQARKPSR